MKKILFVTPGCFDKGGISRYNRYQIEVLRTLYGNDQIRVLSLLGPDSNSIEEELKVHWHGSPIFFLSKIQLVWQMVKALLFWRAEIIHVGHVNFSGLAVILGKLFGAKVLLNVYGLEIWSGMSWDAELGLKHCDQIISDCHNTAQYINKHFHPHPPISVIWDCVNLEKFKFTDEDFEMLAHKYGLPDRDQHFVILTLGRMSPNTDYKGYSRLLEVLVRVIQQKPNAVVVYAGAGDLVHELKGKSKTLGIEDKVFFTGSIGEQDLPGIYSYGHVFSLVTESGKSMGEGIPLTPLEAMACGKPVFVGNQDGSREAIFEGKNGFVLDPHDLDTHAERILQLANLPSQLVQMSNQAAEMARRHFDYASFKVKHKEVFDLINNTHAQ